MKKIISTVGKTLFAMVVLANSGAAEPYHEAYCHFERRAAVAMPSGPPYAVPGFALEIDEPINARIRFRDPETEREIDALSPTGDGIMSFGPYDPASQRLYIWGYWENGWIEVRKQELAQQESVWFFGESGVLAPRLYDPIDDIEDVVTLLPSATTGLLFYQGYTAPQWITGWQSYRVYKIDGAEMTRMRDAEARGLRYIGDDPISEMAVFGSDFGPDSEGWVWYDGADFVEQKYGEVGPVRSIGRRLFSREDWASWVERYRFCVQLSRQRSQ